MKDFQRAEFARKVAWTLAAVAVYRVGCHIPLPGVATDNMAQILRQLSSPLTDMFVGGALGRGALMSLGIMPYITAQIIVQMIGYISPALGDRWRADAVGAAEQTRLTRWITLGIATAEAAGYALLMSQPSDTAARVGVAFGLVAGESVLMLMSELVDQRGLGQGMSVLIFSNVLATMAAGWHAAALTEDAAHVAAETAGVAAVAALWVFIERGQRKLYASLPRATAAGGAVEIEQSYISIKVNSAGVIPVIFVSSLLFLPAQLSALMPDVGWLADLAAEVKAGPALWAVEAAGIVAFGYPYVMTAVDPERIAGDLRRQGAFLTGVMPGADTAAVIRSAVRSACTPGILAMAAITVASQAVAEATGSAILAAASGTSLLIVCGVAIDLAGRVKSETKFANYGFREAGHGRKAKASRKRKK